MSSNKIMYNLKNVHIAIMTQNQDGTYSYDTPVSLPGAVNLSLEAQGDANPFYADGIVYYRTINNNGYEGDLEIALITDWFRQNVLRERRDTNGVFLEKNTDVEPTKFAMLFEFDGDIKAIRHVLYNCTVSNRPTLASQTREDAIEPVTETLAITADARSDGLIKARTGDDTTDEVYQAWYQSVYTPGEVAEYEEAALSALSIGETVLIPTYATDTKTFAYETSETTEAVSATGDGGAAVEITVNGETLTSGSDATWNDGANTVRIKVTKSGYLTSFYVVTVTKAVG